MNSVSSATNGSRASSAHSSASSAVVVSNDMRACHISPEHFIGRQRASIRWVSRGTTRTTSGRHATVDFVRSCGALSHFRGSPGLVSVAHSQPGDPRRQTLPPSHICLTLHSARLRAAGWLDRRTVRWPLAAATEREAEMHPYRTHTCGELRPEHVGQTVRLSGWVHRKRDHGQLLFIDLRDHFGITQIVFQPEHAFFAMAEGARLESVLTVTGHVVARSAETVNAELATGAVELVAEALVVESPADQLPLQVNAERDYPEETRLRYRFLDLRREAMQKNILLRSQVISSIRRRMEAGGLRRVPDPDPDRLLARGRARLPGALAAASGQVLRAAAGAAAVQAAVHDRGLRPLFPDRALLSRRGRARRPQPGRVLPARPGDGVRRAGGRVQGGRAGDAGRVRGAHRVGRHALAVPAHRLSRRAGALRHRQAGSAQPDRDRRRRRRSSRVAALRCSRGALEQGAVVRAVPAPGRGRPAAALLRPDGGLRPEPGRARARLYPVCARARSPGGRSPSSSIPGGSPRSRRRRGSRTAMRCSSSATSALRPSASRGWSAPGSARSSG